MAAMDLTSAVTAIVVLKPMLKRHHAKNAAAFGYDAAAPARASH
jgi:hypothetical protein